MHAEILMSMDNPIIKNHRVYGQSLLPGLAYIDLLYQLFREYGYDYTKLELRHLTIYNPLIVGVDHEVTLNIQGAGSKDGHWRIIVEGKEDARRYVTAEMRQREKVVFEEVLDLEEMKREALKTLNLHQVYEQLRHRGLVHTGFMKAEGSVFILDKALLIHIFLGQRALPGADEFMFHPVLIDGGAIGSWGWDSPFSREDQRLSLPLYYESFQASRLLQKQCIVRIPISSLRQENELSHLTMEFFDEGGKKVGELKNYAGKLVRETGLITPVRNLDIGNNHASNEAAAFLRRLIAERLKKTPEQIDPELGYYEMGLDSPGLLELVGAIESKTNIFLPPTLFFEYSTIAELSAYLAKNYAEHFRETKGSPLSRTSRPGPEGENIMSAGDIPVLAPVNKLSVIKGDDIAVIGIAGRYPKAKNLREFWLNLKKGAECITEIPKSRWEWSELSALESPAGKSISRWGGFIDDFDCFDAEFFRISPRQAAELDPQERVFLETCWAAMEDAGYTPDSLVTPEGENKRRPVGVFVGVMHKDYTLLAAEAISRGEVFPLPLGNAAISNRISYFFNFHGPSITLDTMCSSSLTAVHLALESIRHGESQAALAGGVNLSIHPYKYLTYGLMDMLSGSGCSSAFGSRGDGYISAEGVGVVLLKPIRKAIKDGDHIYAVIKGSAINHGGTASGFMVPSVTAQADLIAECLEKTGVHPGTISYVEAAANGSPLGDPIEVASLTKAFQKYNTDKQYCAIGSVKSNIGHAEGAAGISQLTKVILQLQHQELVPTINTEPLNPNINFEETPFYLPKELRRWVRPVIRRQGAERELPRRAAVNSLGAGGSNVHLIIEEFISSEDENNNNTSAVSPQIIVLSAKKPDRLQAAAEQMLQFAENNEDFSLHDLAYTLQTGRIAMESRMAMVAKNREEFIRGLKIYLGAIKDDKEEEGAIPIFSEDLDAAALPEKIKTAGVSASAGENLENLARSWTQGTPIDWEILHRGKRVRRMSLPTYPFYKKHYLISGNQGYGQDAAIQKKDFGEVPIDEGSSIEHNVRAYIEQFLAGELNLAKDELKPNKSFQDFGMDSIVVTKLLRTIEKRYSLRLTRREIAEYQGIKALSEYLAGKIGEADNGNEEYPKDMGDEILEKFRKGVLTLEEVEELMDKGELI